MSFCFFYEIRHELLFILQNNYLVGRNRQIGGFKDMCFFLQPMQGYASIVAADKGELIFPRVY